MATMTTKQSRKTWNYKLPKLHWPLLLRRVQGESMLPTLRPNQLVLAVRLRKKLRKGDVVIFRHGGMEKLKRIVSVGADGYWLEGDNKSLSTDSRHFGSVESSAVVAKVLLPRV